MGVIEDILNSLMTSLTETLRKFVAYSLIMFAIGMFYGYYLPSLSTRLFVEPWWLFAIPLVLALLAYISTEVAAVIFFLLLFIILVVFI